MDSWDQSTHLAHSSWSNAWSPCSQFVATSTDEGVKILDAFSSELVSTLTGSGVHTNSELAYSPDGCLLAHLSGTLIIWDVQTGGIVKEVQCDKSYSNSMVWSLDGKTIGIARGSTVHVYDIASGTMQSIGTLPSHDSLHLWAHGKSFQAMATGVDGQDLTIEIFKVGSDLTKIKSFHLQDQDLIWSFSPTTYRISIRVGGKLRILNIWNSECLLEEGNRSETHSFSSDGSLFAAYLPPRNVHIWIYTSGCYTPWRRFQTQYYLIEPQCLPLQFSPNLASILSCFSGTLQVFCLDGHPILTCPDNDPPLAVISHCGTYMVTGHQGNSTITITNLLSKTPPQLVDTDLEVQWLAITGNILLVLDSETIVAWRLTEEGVVDGVPAGRRVGRGCSIWAVLAPGDPTFTIKDQYVIIEGMGEAVHVYHSATGGVLQPNQGYSCCWEYTPWDMYRGRHYLHCRSNHHLYYHQIEKWGNLPKDNWPAPLFASQLAWVKDPEGRHRLWVPLEWRRYVAGWLYNITTLWLGRVHETVIIKL